MASKTVSKLYFAALAMLEHYDESLHFLLDDDEADAVDALRRAVDEYQDKELTGGSNDQD